MQDDRDRRLLLQCQLSIMWRFAEEFVLEQIEQDLALWHPSGNVCTVHQEEDGWVADWPDEDTLPLPEATIAWLLWHIEWWWSDTIARVNGRSSIAPEDHRWTGSTTGVTAAKQEWDEILATADLDTPVTWLMPDPQPLWFIASWVNVELTKNLAEINHIKMRQANSATVSGAANKEAPVSDFPVLMHTAIDAQDCRALAEFYRQLLGLRYRDGEEPPSGGGHDDADWLVLLDDEGNRVLTIQEKKDTVPCTWPSEDVPTQMHMDFRVPTVEDLERHRERALQLGARLLHDRSQDEGEPLYVLADPEGHPFCLLVQ